MQEELKLLLVLAILGCCNIIGGTINNTQLKKQDFDVKKMIFGVIQFLGVCLMVLGLTYSIDTIPELGKTLDMGPKAILNGANAIYAVKVSGQLISHFNLKKENSTKNAIVEKEKQKEEVKKEIVENEDDSEYIDM